MYSICPVILLLSLSASAFTRSNRSSSIFIEVACFVLAIFIVLFYLILSNVLFFATFLDIYIDYFGLL